MKESGSRGEQLRVVEWNKILTMKARNIEAIFRRIKSIPQDFRLFRNYKR